MGTYLLEYFSAGRSQRCYFNNNILNRSGIIQKIVYYRRILFQYQAFYSTEVRLFGDGFANAERYIVLGGVAAFEILTVIHPSLRHNVCEKRYDLIKLIPAAPLKDLAHEIVARVNGKSTDITFTVGETDMGRAKC